MPVTPNGVLTYGKSKLAVSYETINYYQFTSTCSIGKAMRSRCQVVSLTFITTEWFLQLKKFESFFQH